MDFLAEAVIGFFQDRGYFLRIIGPQEMAQTNLSEQVAILQQAISDLTTTFQLGSAGRLDSTLRAPSNDGGSAHDELPLVMSSVGAALAGIEDTEEEEESHDEPE